MLAMRVALVQDWLTGMRGGEKVLECLAEIYPEAPIHTLIHVEGSVSPVLESREIVTSFLQRVPFARSHYRHMLPLFPAAIESLDLRGYDLVVSTSHAVAKGVVPDPEALHLSYIHTPMRYVWDLGPEYRSRMSPLPRAVLSIIGPWLRAWDVASNKRVDRFVANSRRTAQRISRYYGREAQVIHPPADTDFFQPTDDLDRDGPLLIVSALVPYKNIELAIEAVRGGPRRLVVVGEGSMRQKLEATAGPEVSFLGAVSGERLRELYQQASALVMPGEEDFGIAPVEAQACGTPVIAYRRGGALDSVIDGETGGFFDIADVDSLRKAIDRTLRIPFNKESLRENALRFSKLRFIKQFRDSVANLIDSPT